MNAVVATFHGCFCHWHLSDTSAQEVNAVRDIGKVFAIPGGAVVEHRDILT